MRKPQNNSDQSAFHLFAVLIVDSQLSILQMASLEENKTALSLEHIDTHPCIVKKTNKK